MATNQLPSIPDLFRQLRDEFTFLIREEVALAKTELKEKTARMSRNAQLVAVGAVIAAAGAVVALIAVSNALSVVLLSLNVNPGLVHWLAPLLTGGTVLLIGYGMINKALSSLKHEPLALPKTSQTLGEDKEWLKRKVV